MEASKKRIRAQTWNGSLLLLLTREVWSTRSATGHAALRSYLASFPANSCAFQSLAWMNVVDATWFIPLPNNIVHHSSPTQISRKENSSPNNRKGRKNIIHRLAPNKLKGRKNSIVHRSAPNKLKGKKNIFHPSAQLKGKNEHCSSISSTQREERTLFIDQLNSKGRTNIVHRSAQLKGKDEHCSSIGS